jgi:hypothetical protein
VAAMGRGEKLGKDGPGASVVSCWYTGSRTRAWEELWDKILLASLNKQERETGSPAIERGCAEDEGKG